MVVAMVMTASLTMVTALAGLLLRGVIPPVTIPRYPHPSDTPYDIPQ